MSKGEPRRPRVVYRWDLDKTYLRTEFDTVRDLLRTAVEPAARKRTVPGAGALLRELSSTGPAGIFILSGSPQQMRRVLEAKLRLDGIHWDSFTLKPSLQNLMRGRFRFLKDQVGYKLEALLVSRSRMDGSTDEVLFGDDAEADAFIYSLYGDICAGRVSQDSLVEVLERARVHPHEIPSLVRMAARVPRRDAVRHIFIHLERISPLSGFEEFGRRVCPFYNYFQPACVLVEAGDLDGVAALRVGGQILAEHAFSPDALIASFTDLVRRGYVGPRSASRLVESSDAAQRVRPAPERRVLRQFTDELARRLPDLEPPPRVPAVEVDYAALFNRDKARARAAKTRARVRGARMFRGR